EAVWLREAAGLDLREAEDEIVTTEQGPVIVFRDWIVRRGEDGEGWERGKLSGGRGLPHGLDFEDEDWGLQGYAVYWDPKLEMYLLEEIRWPYGEDPEVVLIPWVDLSGLGKVHALEMGGEGTSRLFIGGLQGLLVADRGLSQELPGPRTPLLYAEGGVHPLRGELTFGYGEDRLQFHYRTPLDGGYFPVRYQTRLLGQTEEWSAPRRISFRELGRIPGGHYRFEVRAVDPFGRVSPAASVDLRILSPWYASGAAYVAYIFLLAVLGMGIMRLRERTLRRRQLELEEQVRERTGELERANAFKDDFIANLSHEIRNPLTGVIGFIGRLKPGSSISGRNLEALRGAAEYLHTTVEQVLDFSRLESGEIDLELKPFSVREVLGGTIEIYRQEAVRKGIMLTSQIRVPEGVAVVSDARKLQQIVGNLTGNAIKFTEEGSVHVGLSLDETEGEGRIRLWVKDTGRGIAEEDKERIFDKFCQVRQGTAKTPGTGLGLTLVKNFVERLGGTLDLKTEPGRGSTFYVTLPVSVQPADVDALEGSPGEGGSFAGLPVLVVEDHEYNRLFLEDLLADFGCAVDSAEEGPRGLELARTGKYAVILLDWDLPGMKGLEIARSLRENPPDHRDLRIIGMTAFATPDVPEKCLQAGMDTFLNKPVLPDQLRKVLAFCQEEKRLLRGPGILEEMSRKGDWRGVSGRWADYAETYLGELEAHLEGAEPEAIRRAAHRFLGHLRMIAIEELPDAVTDLLTVAQAGDLEGARREWEDLQPLLARFRRELESLRETGSPQELTHGYGKSGGDPSG
ncbi:MAG: ATP-binding protein, partial [Oceanipulchritudo sp.]